MNHTILDARSLAMHRLAVEKIRQLLDQGEEHVLSLAIEDSEYAAAMRQSTPFAGVLTPQERWQFLLEWKQQHAASPD